jgi:hypothetical protein
MHYQDFANDSKKRRIESEGEDDTFGSSRDIEEIEFPCGGDSGEDL